MEKPIMISANLLVCEAEKLLKKHGLLVEQEVMEMIKGASDIIWNNADPNTDESWMHWITSKELYIAEYIGELHRETVKKYFVT